MSLYNNVASSLGIGGGLGGLLSQGIKGATNSLISNIGGSISQSLGGSRLVNAATNIAANAASKAAVNAVNRYVPASVQHALNTGMSAAGSLLNGDLEGAGLKILESGLIQDAFSRSGIGQAIRGGRANPLLGGLTMSEARKIYSEMREHTLAKKNLFFLEVSSPLSGTESCFNLFATDIEYSPFVVEADKLKVGGATVDSVTGNGPCEISITTMDDAQGTLKKWFATHHAAATAKDGTVGEPGLYAIRIKVLHHYIDGSGVGYADIGLFRPENLSISLSRRDDNLEELQMQFSQLDTFMSA